MRPRPLRLLVVESALRENGGIRVTLDYMARWRSAGDEVVLAVVQDVDDGPVARTDPRLDVRFLSHRGTRARYAVAGALVRLARLARGADVVLSGSEEGHGLLLGWLAAKLARRPFAVLAQCDVEGSVRAWVPRPLHGPTRWIHAHVDASVGVAESVRDGVVALGLPPARAHVVGNGVDVEAVRARGRATASRSVPPRTVVACGRLAAAKDFELLVRAHARLLAAGVDQQLLILGEGPERPALERLVDELGVPETVSMPGFVEDAPAMIARAELFVLSSRFEGAPLVLLEALALDVPIVSTRCASAVEEFLGEDDDGAVGTIVEVGALDELVEAIAGHLRDGGRGRRSGAGPRRAQRYDAQRSSERIREILREATEDPRSKQSDTVGPTNGGVA